MEMEVDAGNFRESRRVDKDKMFKMCIFCIGVAISHNLNMRRDLCSVAKRTCEFPCKYTQVASISLTNKLPLQRMDVTQVALT